MKNFELLCLAFFCTTCMYVSVAGYRPVIIVHGILDSPKQLSGLARFIAKSHPGTEVIPVNMFNYLASFKRLWKQVESIKRFVYPIMQKAKDGVHLICFSQGGLICRGILATLPTHNVHSLICLSSPLAGQYGDTSYLRHFFPRYIKPRVHRICYNPLGQRISVCNYWKDPHQENRYLKGNNYLPLLNGERAHSNILSWKRNFLRIKKLVLIGGPDDGVITPWQSSLFGFYDSNENVVDMKHQNWYLKDTFGLKTLDANGGLHQCVFSGVRHTSWHSNFTVFRDCIEPWLT
ncbi:lysosomal thioesterase PPT2-like [Chanos chanos]|uniref:palmitoyl-CoA hydrolase n=1 Tax=Chanos chanos TaxID=29144 RepID=A0A6J2W3W6_CHACN|nr:lysosomal thioesterase PPT2-like [Chanos chanos]